MSWIIGVCGDYVQSISEKIKSLLPQYLVEIDEKNLFVAAGGNNKTCHFSHVKKEHHGYIAVGLGIDVSTEKQKILSTEDWRDINNTLHVQELNGHFVLFRWDNKEIKIFTDRLGQRDIYLHKYSDNTFIFSTRVDWINKFIKTKLDFKEFGSRWLLFNQVSSKSIFENIERISSGTSILIKRDNFRLTKTKNNWLPSVEGVEYSLEEFSETLNKLCTFPFLSEQKISMSLSGGMDSRVILSCLVNNKNDNWYTHTFGDAKHPDALMADKICSSMNIRHEQINLPFPQTIDCITDLKEYVAQTMLNNAASAYIQQRNYNPLSGRNEVIIDGGFGEIWRREYFNRLLIRGRKALINKNEKEIIPYLTIHRADIFDEEIKTLMHNGCEEQINQIFNELPDMSLIGIENFIDLFAIKTRLVNYSSHEQMRLDSMVTVICRSFSMTS